MLRVFAALAVCCFIAGCSIVNQQNAQREQAQLKRLWMERFDTDSLVSKIQDKVWFREINEAPLRYFTNKNYVTDEDRPSLERSWAISQENGLEIEAFFKKYGPHHVSILESYRAATFTIFVQLFEGKITYGEYHLKRREISARSKEAIAERDREIAMRQSDAQSQALGNYLNFLTAQSLINNQRQPAVTAPPNITYEIYAPPPVNIQPPRMPGIIR